MSQGRNKVSVKIGEAANALGVHKDTLRRWEKAGKIEATRSKKGTRLYDLDELKKFHSQIQAKPSFEQTAFKKLQPVKIAQAANILGVHKDTLRRWEKSGKLGSERSVHGARLYDISQLQRVEIKPRIKPALSTESLLQATQATSGVGFDSPEVSDYQNVSEYHKDIHRSLKLLSGFTIFILTVSFGVAAFVTFSPQFQTPEEKIIMQEGKVLAATAFKPVIKINADTKINGALNEIILAGTPSASTISLSSGNTTLTVTDSTTLNQDLSTTASPTFAGLTVLSPINAPSLSTSELIFDVSGQTGTISWTPTATRTITLPDATTTLVGTDTTQTLTNKTMSGSSNTFSSIPNSALSNSKVTVSAGTNLTGGGDVSLGSSVTLTLKDSVSLAGTLTVSSTTSFNGVTYTWPSADGSASSALTTNSAGTLSWSSLSSAAGWTDDGTVIRLTTSTDNVGIGTTAPASKLAISGNAGIGISFAGYFPPANGLIVEGNVGVGFSSPASALTVGSSAQFAVSSSGDLAKINNISYSFPSSQAAGSNYVLANDASGNLSWQAVSGVGGISGTGFSGAIPYFNSASAVTATPNFYWNSSSSRLGIGTSSPGGSLVVASGNVGIGLTTPAAALDVSGTVNISGATVIAPSTGGTTTSLTVRAANGSTGNILNVTNTAGSTSYLSVDSSGSLTVGGNTLTASGNLEAGGKIQLTDIDDAVVGTAIEGGWTMNSNTFTYRRPITVTNNDGSNALPVNYEVTVTISGSNASQIYSNTQSDGDDFRIAYNSTEITRNITTYTSSSIVFTFQLQAAIAASGTSTAYYIYYKNSALTCSSCTYTGNVTLDAMDDVSPWTSSDTTQFPIAVNSVGGNTGIGVTATVDNIGTFSTSSQGQLAAARTNFGFDSPTISSIRYLYVAGGSTDGTAANAQTTVYRTSVAAASGNIASWTTNANSLSTALMDNTAVSATPPLNGGDGTDGAIDLTNGLSDGGCTGEGLYWNNATSVCTIESKSTNAVITGPSLPTAANAGAGSHSFQRADGKFVTITGNTTTITNIYDPATNKFDPGPDLTATATSGSHTFMPTTGTAANSFITVVGSSSTTNIYDPASNTFIAGPSLTTVVANTAHTFMPTTGTAANSFITVTGTGTVTNIYNPASNTFIAGPSLTAGTVSGAHTFMPTTGTAANSFITVVGSSSTTTNIYDPASNTFIAGPSLTTGASTSGGTHSFMPTTGTAANSFITVVGGSSTTTNIYDPANNTFVAGPSLTTAVLAGAHTFMPTTGTAANSFITVTNTGPRANIYLPASNTFVAGPNLTTLAGSGSHTFMPTSGPAANSFITVTGGGKTTTSIYTSNVFTTGPSLTVYTTGAGSHSFQRADGKYVTVTGNSQYTSAIYDPVTNSFSSGPNLTTGSSSGYTFMPTTGTATNSFITVTGTGTVTNIYNPASNTFIAGPNLTTGAAGGAHSFMPTTGTAANSFITVVGNSATTNIYNPASNTFIAGPSLTTAVSVGAHSFMPTTGTAANSFITITNASGFGAYRGTNIYVPNSNTFIAGPNLTTGAAGGAHTFMPTTGPVANSFITVIGDNTGLGTDITNIYDPASNTFISGPSLGNGVGAGASSSLRSDGKWLTVVGRSGSNTRIYDPANNTFSAGPNTDVNVASGGHSIKRSTGQYVIVHGGGTLITTSLYTGSKTTFNFTTVNIPNGTTLQTDGPYASATVTIPTINATGNVTINGSINLNALGYQNTVGTGTGSNGTSSGGGGGGGAGFGAVGGKGSATGGGNGGTTYDTAEPGSGGGNGYGNFVGGYGGGGISIVSASTITISSTGSVTANGGTGTSTTTSSRGGGGGGSGGKISLQANTITINASGQVTANGGNGGNSTSGGGGGGGGGGRVSLQSNTLTNNGTVSASHGTLGTGGSGGANGSDATPSQTQTNPTLYVLGGKNTSGTAQSNIYLATITASDGSVGVGTTSPTPLPQALFGHTSTAVTVGSSNYIYVIGGNNGTSDQTTVYKTSIAADSSISAITTTGQTQLGTGISYHAVANATISSTQYIWVIGGLNGSTAQTTVYKGTLDSSGNVTALTTTGQSTLPTALYGHSAFVATVGSTNYLFVIGGMTTGGTRQTTVYKAVIDSSGNVGSFTTVGQTQLTTATGNQASFNFTDSSSNQYAYMIGGNTAASSGLTAVYKATYSPIDQTTYNLSRTITSANLSNKNDIQYRVYSSRTGSYANLQFYDATGGWQTCSFTVSSASTWETKTCDITGVSSANKDAVTQLRLAVSSSSTSQWTAYFDNITGLTDADTISNTASGGSAVLGSAHLTLNAQGSGAILLNYDTAGSAGTGGMIVYNGTTTPLLTMNSAGNLGIGIGSTSPIATLQVGSNLALGGSEIVLTSAGNLGIGTTQPGSRLSVAGNVGIGFSFANAAAPVNGLAIEGNLGIGTTTTNANLVVAGNVGIGWTGTNPVMPSLGLSVFGNVGIGTTTAQYRLDVAGGARFACGNSTWNSGPVTTCSDVAEVYQSDGTVEAGDIVVIPSEQSSRKIATDSANPRNDSGKVTKSTTPYEKDIIGVYSTSPGLLIGGQTILGSNANLEENQIPVALSGRTPVKVSTENGPIEAGDYLTSSSTPGVAMKALRPGPVVGKALEGFPTTDYRLPHSEDGSQKTVDDLAFGKIMAFINVSYADPGNFFASLSLDSDGNLIIPKIKTSSITLDSSIATSSSSLRTSETSAAISINEGITSPTSLPRNDSVSYDLSDKIASLEERIAVLEQRLSSDYSLPTTATDSATLTEDRSQKSVDNLNLTPPDILLASSSAQLTSLTTSEATVSGMLTAYSAQIQDHFKVLGDTTLAKTAIAGDLTVDGTLSLSGNSINALSILYLQNNPLSSLVDIFNGKVTIDKNGRIIAVQVQTDKLILGPQVLGESKILTGTAETKVETSAITEKSKVFITPQVETDTPLFVTDKIIGQSFKVKTKTPALNDIIFDWTVLDSP